MVWGPKPNQGSRLRVILGSDFSGAFSPKLTDG